MSKLQVYFVSGSSGVGKSSTMKYLKELLPAEEYDMRDFDERGVPDGGGREWHNAETLHWLEVAAENAKLGKSTIICGFQDPEYFSKIHDKDRHTKAKLILLHASSEVIRQRLIGRYPTKESIEEINRMSGMPLDQFVEDIVKYTPQLRSTFEKHNLPIIDTDHKTPGEVAREIADLVLKSE